TGSLFAGLFGGGNPGSFGGMGDNPTMNDIDHLRQERDALNGSLLRNARRAGAGRGESVECPERDRQAANEHMRHFQAEAHRQAEEARERAERADGRDVKRKRTRAVWYTSSMVHIAVAGISGCGKSSLVNSFRGLLPKAAGAAKTGIVETTTEVSRYADPDPSKPIIWFDVPGAGTLNISDWDYFNAQGLFIFDAIVVVFCRPFLRHGYRDLEGVQEILYTRVHRQVEIGPTRRNVKANLKQAGLPDKRALWAIVKKKQKPGNTIVLDEERLLKVMVGDGIKRRFKPTPALSSVLNRLGVGRMA
ncbi:interferon-inducible GTPase-domain-containing protein, partial [Mucidula mucida]